MKYIGLDVGTSSCKVAVIDERGGIHASASREYAVETPAAGFVELNPLTVWHAVEEALCEIAPECGDAKAIAVSSIGESMVILDKNDNPIANGIVYLDERCKGVLETIAQQMPREELFAVTGVPLNQMFSLNHLLWYRQNRPEVLEQGAHYFLFGDYITYMLSGERAIDPSAASRTMFFDAFAWDWSVDIAKRFDVPVDRFSPVCKIGTVLSTIRREVALKTGLPQNLRVVTGCHDQCSASLGSGSIHAGDATLGEGSSESLNLIVAKNDISTEISSGGFGCEPYINPELYMVPVGQIAHGACIKWFVRLFESSYLPEKKSKESIYAVADRLCADSPGELFFLPYLTRSSATNTHNSAFGGFIGMDFSANRDSMYRALLEGLCYETRMMAELLERYGMGMKSIVATGGGSKSPLYMQMKANVLQRSIGVLGNAESGIAGLGMICAVACGEYADYDQAAAQFARAKTVFSPQQNHEQGYRDYLEVSSAIKALYNKRGA